MENYFSQFSAPLTFFSLFCLFSQSYIFIMQLLELLLYPFSSLSTTKPL